MYVAWGCMGTEPRSRLAPRGSFIVAVWPRLPVYSVYTYSVGSTAGSQAAGIQARGNISTMR